MSLSTLILPKTWPVHRLVSTSLALFTHTLLGVLCATTFYVSPNGSSQGDGSAARPWSLTAAVANSRVLPGDTVCLTGGRYRAPDYLFRIRLQGASGQYITVRPCGSERVTIEGGIEILTSWVIFRDFEIMYNPPTRISSQAGSFPTDVIIPTGVVVTAPYVKVINNIVHDLSNGLASWRNASNNEFYGNIVYNNGWKGTDRSHGHGLYMQNEGAPKTINDNVVFNQFELGMQLYGSSGTRLDNFQLDGNVVFNSGVLGGRYARNILLGGTVIATNPVLTNNVTYFPTGWNHGGENNLGYYNSGSGCTNLRLENNYFISGGFSLTLHRCTVASFRGNTLFGYDRGYTPATYPDNQYLGLIRPQGARVFVRPNRYETGRAHIAVFNWDRRATVDADVSGTGLAIGDRYEVYDIQNPLGQPVLQGTYDGRPISLPMTMTAVARPIGITPVIPTHTDMEFNAFLLRKSGGGTTPTPTPPPAETPLQISNVQVSQITSSSAVVTWTTNKIATSQLGYGRTSPNESTLTITSIPSVNHSANLTGLSAGTLYQLAPRSTDINGVTVTSAASFTTTAASTPSPTPTPQPSTGYAAYMEAENSQRVGGMLVGHSSISSSGKHVYSSVPNTSTSAFNMLAPSAGTYAIWARVIATAPGASTLAVSIDGGAEELFEAAYGSWSAAWQWSKVNSRPAGSSQPPSPRVFQLSRGWHRIVIRAVHANVSIDGIVLTDDPALVPSGSQFLKLP